MSPSMDILISSNLERLIWLVSGANVTSDCMKKLAEDGKYTVPEETLKKIKDVFSGYYADEMTTAETLRTTFKDYGYLADTHTSVAIRCYNAYRNETGDNTQTVIVSTASPFKFAYDVSSSLGHTPESHDPKELLNTLERIGNTTAPAPLKKTLELPVRFKDAVPPEKMKKYIFKD